MNRRGFLAALSRAPIDMQNEYPWHRLNNFALKLLGFGL